MTPESLEERWRIRQSDELHMTRAFYVFASCLLAVGSWWVPVFWYLRLCYCLFFLALACIPFFVTALYDLQEERRE